MEFGSKGFSMSTQSQSQQRGEDAIVVSPQIRPNKPILREPVSKKPRISDETSLSCLFFKTRLCFRFRSGVCNRGLDCSFAHGPEELRKPPPNWEQIHGFKRESNASKEVMLQRCDASEPWSKGTVVVDGGGGCGEMPGLRKTKMCRNWEVDGFCVYGKKCHFAHGHEELKDFRILYDLNNAKAARLPLLPPLQPIKDATPSAVMSGIKHYQTKGLLKWEVLQKISRIYADWIDN